MIGALAYSSVAFEQSEWRDIAERCALFILKNFKDNSGKWLHSWIDGHAYIDATLEDYAYFLWGIVELCKSAKHFNSGDKQLHDWLNCAKDLADTMTSKFWDEKRGGFFMSSGDDPKIYIRMKSSEDTNSLPSANALASMALNVLAETLEEKKYSDYARKINECFAYNARENPLSYLSLINASLSWKPVKKKPEPETKPIPTDEELNTEEQEVKSVASKPEAGHKTRTSRRTERALRGERNGTAERRSARHRATRR